MGYEPPTSLSLLYTMIYFGNSLKLFRTYVNQSWPLPGILTES